jgi:DNA excision repair protein ERCC-1
MVDIPNHEDSLRELAKTSLVNNVTVILCWSAAEAARYLELYKSYEHAGFSAIQGHQATGYAEKLVEFVTVPRSVNKADAVALVSTFGSLRHAINADPEQVSVVGGWGEKKVKAWCKVVEEPFRVKKAAKRRAKGTGVGAPASASRGGVDVPLDEDEELEALFAAEAEGSSSRQSAPQPKPAAAASSREEQLSDGIAAALAKLREKG